MGKLLGMLVSLVAAVCVATVISAATLITYYGLSWKVSRGRVTQALAILQGKALETLVPPPPPKNAGDSEQPAYEQVLAAQGLKARDLEQRELAVRANLEQFQQQLDKIVEEKKRVQAIQDDLQAKLEELTSGAKTAGTENVSQLLQKIKAKQAKDLLKMKLDKGEVDVVVALFANMPDDKRAKIIAEFKTPTEMDQIGEVLNRIRQGQPTTEMLDETAKKLQPPKGPGTP
jgi:uncharacterized protein YhaN